MSTPHFGPPPGHVMAKTPRHPFTLSVIRDDKVETHSFQAVPRLNALSLLGIVQSKEDDPNTVGRLIGTMTRMLDDKDGVPSEWRPTPLPPRKVTETPLGDSSFLRSIAEDDAIGPTAPGGSETEQNFRGPDGQIYPMSEASRFEEASKGSSRRRWRQLIAEDDSVTVDMQDLVKLFEWMISLAGKEATRASS